MRRTRRCARDVGRTDEARTGRAPEKIALRRQLGGRARGLTMAGATPRPSTASSIRAGDQLDRAVRRHAQRPGGAWATPGSNSALAKLVGDAGAGRLRPGRRPERRHRLQPQGPPAPGGRDAVALVPARRPTTVARSDAQIKRHQDQRACAGPLRLRPGPWRARISGLRARPAKPRRANGPDGRLDGLVVDCAALVPPLPDNGIAWFYSGAIQRPSGKTSTSTQTDQCA